MNKIEKFFLASDENGYPHSVTMNTQNESLFCALTFGEFIAHCFVWLCAETDNRCSDHNLSCVEYSTNKWMRPHKTSVRLCYKDHFIVLIFIDVFLCLFSWFWKSSRVHFFLYNVNEAWNKRKKYCPSSRDRRMTRNIIFGTRNTGNVSMNLCDSCNRHGICAYTYEFDLFFFFRMFYFGGMENSCISLAFSTPLWQNDGTDILHNPLALPHFRLTFFYWPFYLLFSLAWYSTALRKCATITIVSGLEFGECGF